MTIQYLMRRLLLLVLVILTAATINFFLPKLSPRDPILERLQQAAVQGGRQQTGLEEMVAAYRQKFGLDKPLWQQYLTYMVGIVRFDFGLSISQYPRPVTDIIAQAMPWTLIMAVVTTIIAFIIGTVLGALLAWPRSPRFLQALVPPLMVLNSVPFFVLALLLIDVVAFRLKLLPLAGAYSRGAVAQWSPKFALDVASHAILPALSIIIVSVGGWALSMRGLMVMTQGEDYITYAEARGLRSNRIFSRYAMRNALLPQVTGLLLSFGFIITGTVLIEPIFGYPGLGSLIFSSIAVLDYNLIYGITMILIITLCLATLIMDLIYPLLDPRIRYERG